MQETVKGFSVLAEFCKLKKVKIYKQKKKEKQIWLLDKLRPINHLADGNENESFHFMT